MIELERQAEPCIEPSPPGRRLSVWHVGASASPSGINGVNSAVWLLASHQARLGNDVCLLLTVPPDGNAVEFAQRSGIQLIQLPASCVVGLRARRLDAELQRHRPDIVNMHSVFIPYHAMLAWQLARRRIPYAITPHGGVAGAVLSRSRLKKNLYTMLVERPRFRRAAAIALTPGEEPALRSFAGKVDGLLRQVAVPVEPPRPGEPRWKGNVQARRLVFLGRFDIFVKGIDRLVAIAGLMRDHEFHLYGASDPKVGRQLRRLLFLPNVFIHPPVFGAEKARVLCDASLYIQMSRSESFGISIAEAMLRGVPCAIPECINLATAFDTHDLGLTLPCAAGLAAASITRAINDPDQLMRWSERARDFATVHFSPSAVAESYLQVYRDVLSATRGGA